MKVFRSHWFILFLFHYSRRWVKKILLQFMSENMHSWVAGMPRMPALFPAILSPLCALWDLKLPSIPRAFGFRSACHLGSLPGLEADLPFWARASSSQEAGSSFEPWSILLGLRPCTIWSVVRLTPNSTVLRVEQARPWVKLNRRWVSRQTCFLQNSQNLYIPRHPFARDSA